MRIFVLCTGRTGSMTFARACGHLSNYTASHERNVHVIGLDERLDYPDQHIEVDNRLMWFLGPLADRYPDAFYVHLTRDRAATVSSIAQRKSRSSIIRAFGRGILIRSDQLDDQERTQVAQMYVDTANATIEAFLRGRDHMRVAVETISTDFPEFLARIGAEGDLEGALAEWRVRHNVGRSVSTGLR